MLKEIRDWVKLLTVEIWQIWFVVGLMALSAWIWWNQIQGCMNDVGLSFWTCSALIGK